MRDDLIIMWEYAIIVANATVANATIEGRKEHAKDHEETERH